jgi:hypothetical protein
MTPQELLLQATRILDFADAEEGKACPFSDSVDAELRRLAAKLIDSALEQLAVEPLLQGPPQIQRERLPPLSASPAPTPTMWPSAVGDAASVSTGSRANSAYNNYMSEAISMVHTLFPTQSHRANFTAAAGAWKRIKRDGVSTQQLVADARDLILRESVIDPPPTQRTVPISA